MTDKISQARCFPERGGLVWVEIEERDDESGLVYPVWLLVDSQSDRMIVSIEGPTCKQVCYRVDTDTNMVRKFISLDGAKRFAVSAAMQILQEEAALRSASRKSRRMGRAGRIHG